MLRVTNVLIPFRPRIPSVRGVQTLAHEYIFDKESGHDKKKTCLLLHGLLGNKRNMKSFANLIARTHKDWQVLLMDIRGHGLSTDMNPNTDGNNHSTLYDAAEDIAYTCNQLGIPPPNMIIGHSMGGKIALSYLDGILSNDFINKYFSIYNKDEIIPNDIWLMDSIPSLLNREKNIQDKESVASVLENVSKAKLDIVQNKQDLVDQLIKIGTSLPTAQWMTTNIKINKNNDDGDGSNKHSFQWLFDLPTCNALYNNYSIIDFIPLICNSQSNDKTNDEKHKKYYDLNTCAIHTVIAGKNLYSWPVDVVECLKVTSSDEIDKHGKEDAMCTLDILPKSGHNIHMDDPKGMLALMESSFNK